MTTAQQRTRAIEFAGEILRDLQRDLALRMNKQRQQRYLERVVHVLRHYPSAAEISDGAASTAYYAAQHRMEPWVAPIEPHAR